MHALNTHTCTCCTHACVHAHTYVGFSLFSSPLIIFFSLRLPESSQRPQKQLSVVLSALPALPVSSHKQRPRNEGGGVMTAAGHVTVTSHGSRKQPSKSLQNFQACDPCAITLRPLFLLCCVFSLNDFCINSGQQPSLSSWTGGSVRRDILSGTGELVIWICIS